MLRLQFLVELKCKFLFKHIVVRHFVKFRHHKLFFLLSALSGVDRSCLWLASTDIPRIFNRLEGWHFKGLFPSVVEGHSTSRGHIDDFAVLLKLDGGFIAGFYELEIVLVLDLDGVLGLLKFVLVFGELPLESLDDLLAHNIDLVEVVDLLLAHINHSFHLNHLL